MSFSEELEQEGRGRSAKKRAAKAIEELASQLVELDEGAWQKAPLADDLRKVAKEARATRNLAARKRQTKYLAGQLRKREDDADALQAYLDGCHEQHYAEQKEFHVLEQWRDELCAKESFDAALTRLQARLSNAQVEEIARLARAYHASSDRKVYRDIFRKLRSAMEKSAAE